MAVLQPLRDLSINEILLPDKIDADKLMHNEFNSDFVISRDQDGNILSKYADDVWDLSPYNSNKSVSPIFNFLESFSSVQKEECKKIFFLLYCYGSGRNNSTFSIGTLKTYISLLSAMAEYADNENIEIIDMLTIEYHLLNYIKNYMALFRTKSLLSLLNFFKNKATFLNYKESKTIIELLRKIKGSYNDNSTQTLTIPSRILTNSIQERWRQIDEIEKNLNNLNTFLYNYLNSPSFAYQNRGTKAKDKKNAVKWEEAVKEHNLNELFQKYNITNRINFKRLVTQIQGTCYHLILSYSGMRKSEGLSLKNNCLEEVNGTFWLIGKTTKLEGQVKQVKWVTTKELKRVIDILNSINSSIGKHHNIALSDLPLFPATKNMTSEDFKSYVENKSAFANRSILPINENQIQITKQDFEEIKDIDFVIDEDTVKVGTVWNFTPHQYRRSLAVYAIQSGMVSLGALQIQFKHLFREMTLYYSSGSSFAKKLFDDGIKEHISKDIRKLEPDIQALTYIKEVLLSGEKLYGLHGKAVENSIKKENNDSYRSNFLENREETLRRFKNGELAYKSTALGGCVATEACDSRLTRSITACFDCDGGILKKSKVDKVIEKQKEFINFLDKDSIEYRTEVEELGTLEEMSKKLIGE